MQHLMKQLSDIVEGKALESPAESVASPTSPPPTGKAILKRYRLTLRFIPPHGAPFERTDIRIATTPQGAAGLAKLYYRQGLGIAPFEPTGMWDELTVVALAAVELPPEAPDAEPVTIEN
ncbi:hypothetical protein UFOVP28_18 [uncultured Caudovirales phage]|uniref:Uncharacterized protein n=1 Tax=uncultured Caudovirales phage TaxID=2100421 RepID=A0A6J5KN12_9CAUD|nr:hypothetical protein UFOVP28_18 [uncultured Caudovirales phage]